MHAPGLRVPLWDRAPAREADNAIDLAGPFPSFARSHRVAVAASAMHAPGSRVPLWDRAPAREADNAIDLAGPFPSFARSYTVSTAQRP